MAWSDISIQCMQRNPEGATRLGLFLGLGSDPNDWEDGHIKPLLIEKKLNDKKSFKQMGLSNFDYLKDVKLKDICYRY